MPNLLRKGIDLDQAIYTSTMIETSGTDTDLRKIAPLYNLFGILDTYRTDELVNDIFPKEHKPLVHLMTNPGNHRIKLATALAYLEVMSMEVDGAAAVAENFNNPEAFEETYDDINLEISDLDKEFRRREGLGKLGSIKHNPIIDAGKGTCRPIIVCARGLVVSVDQDTFLDNDLLLETAIWAVHLYRSIIQSNTTDSSPSYNLRPHTQVGFYSKVTDEDGSYRQTKILDLADVLTLSALVELWG